MPSVGVSPERRLSGTLWLDCPLLHSSTPGTYCVIGSQTRYQGNGSDEENEEGIVKKEMDTAG